MEITNSNTVMILQESKRLKNMLSKWSKKALPEDVRLEQRKDFSVFKFITHIYIVIKFKYITNKAPNLNCIHHLENYGSTKSNNVDYLCKVIFNLVKLIISLNIPLHLWYSIHNYPWCNKRYYYHFLSVLNQILLLHNE